MMVRKANRHAESKGPFQLDIAAGSKRRPHSPTRSHCIPGAAVATTNPFFAASTKK